ncbi:hypothetical protein SME05J_47610 [Serratia marcescens]|nr:hypothetical protein SME05J_47610 [Serratia marcescens]
MGAFLVGEQIAAGTLVPVLERYCRPGPPSCAVYPSRRPLSAKVKLFLAAIERRWQGDLGNCLAWAIHAAFKASVRRIKR